MLLLMSGLSEATMRVQISCRTNLSVRRLVPAFPMRITALQGIHRLTRRGFLRTLREDCTVEVPAFESIDLHFEGGFFAVSTCSVELDSPVSATPSAARSAALGTALPQARTLRDAISGIVFREPQQMWTAHTVAEALSTTPERIRSALFMEGVAFTQLCRTQRLMRAFFEIMQMERSVSDLKDVVGWGGKGDLEGSFYDWFGVSLHTVSRLREGRP